MTVFYYGLTILTAYLIGSSSMAFYLSRLYGVDIRKVGSGNLGASNALVAFGWKAAVIVGLHDLLKGLLAVLLARHFLPQLPFIGAVAGVACVMGHMFPFYLGFKGGKGLASYLGMTIALNWRLAVVIAVAIVIITLVTDYIAVGTVTTVIAVPAYMGIASRSWVLAAILCAASLVMIAKHRDNYVRILSGTEIGLRRANRGDDRQNK